MNLDTTRVPEDSLGSLNICLLEGDPQQQRRARNVRRRAILFSVALQTIAVTALIVFPLLGKGERPSTKICLPLPPYRLGSPQPAGETGSKDPARDQRPCLFCKNNLTPGLVVLHHPGGVNSSDPGLPPGIDGPPFGDPNGVINGIEPPHTPPPPTDSHPLAESHRRVIITHIDPSRIIRRVEPIYPPLGFQLHRETRVELRAIISTDGTIQSLQVISGDPLFYPSALNAVRQWRYTPTLLNDQPVEVDTYITVIYSLVR